MRIQQAALSLFLTLPLSQAEITLGAYISHRHGDRTPKSIPPVVLTDLGYQEVYNSGQYIRERYVDSSASTQIAGISPSSVVQSQINVVASDDVVLVNSAMGFLQGLYPPVGAGALSSQTLRNGTTIQAPLDGYQLIPVHILATGSGSESVGWLQGASGCANAMQSSSQYFSSAEYMSMLSSTNDFYGSLIPVINGTFTASQSNFKNAYVSESS